MDGMRITGARYIPVKLQLFFSVDGARLSVAHGKTDMLAWIGIISVAGRVSIDLHPPSKGK